MPRRLRFVACLVVCCAGLPAFGQVPGGDADSLESVGAALKPLLADAVPPVLYEKAYDWGRQSPTPHAVRWHGLRPEIVKEPRNDGTWRKIRVTPRNLPGTLELHLSDLKPLDADRQSFRVFLAFQTTVEFEQQIWENGVRLYSGSTRARLRLKLAMECENTLKVETGKRGLPDFVFRLRVAKADLMYDNLVVEHTASVGGTAARWAGELVRSTLKQARPSLERDLLARANKAIVRAADTREVRVGLGEVGKKK